MDRSKEQCPEYKHPFFFSFLLFFYSGNRQLPFTASHYCVATEKWLDLKHVIPKQFKTIYRFSLDVFTHHHFINHVFIFFPKNLHPQITAWGIDPAGAGGKNKGVPEAHPGWQEELKQTFCREEENTEN